MKIIIIAAVSRNGFIGKNNQLMWKLPNDLKRFKHFTLGETILMGRNTFESVGKILTKRRKLILTNSNSNALKNNVKKSGGILISSVREINNFLLKKLFIIGGEKTYVTFFEMAHTIELTLIHKDFIGDTKFPKIKYKNWKKIYEWFYEKDQKNMYDYSFIKFEKKH
ncbi:dihydrofolate reductase [Blattabacterium cuenoti]|uniref:dihydrofolate reductase n=1 Tax=Blattabacterium cuenoti TaxID=1653831 RepID=UPI00163C2EDA|nr:dihydrofolate reductase [Blattabacterium cuenoti]